MVDGRGLPIVRRSLPEVPAYIVGSNPTTRSLLWRETEWRFWGGYRILLRCTHRRVCSVAPLRYGAGIRGKIGESTANGLPVVSTSIGAEGTRMLPEQDIVVADDPEAFAASIVRVYNDPTLWRTLATNGHRAIASQCSPSVVQSQLARALADLGVNL